MNTVVDNYEGTYIIVPDCAYCLEAKKKLVCLDQCPTYEFDDLGDTCIPDLCNYYTEDWAGEYRGEEDD